MPFVRTTRGSRTLPAGYWLNGAISGQRRRRAGSDSLYVRGQSWYCCLHMKRLQPVIWSKGTFLTPQHLQIQDRFIEDTLGFTLGSLNYRPWGFGRLAINQEALAGGVLAISLASGLFPDGMPFDIPDSDPAPPPKPTTPEPTNRRFGRPRCPETSH